MGKDAIEGLVSVATLVIVVAIVAVLVSRNSQTGSVLTAGGNALANALRAAMGPVGSTGSSSSAATTELGQLGTLNTGQLFG